MAGVLLASRRGREGGISYTLEHLTHTTAMTAVLAVSRGIPRVSGVDACQWSACGSEIAALTAETDTPSPAAAEARDVHVRSSDRACLGHTLGDPISSPEEDRKGLGGELHIARTDKSNFFWGAIERAAGSSNKSTRGNWTVAGTGQGRGKRGRGRISEPSRRVGTRTWDRVDPQRLPA